ncbi:MAG TPA: response regulator [Planctomycetota bacterium]|jgi:CheY-like chemotaxis protein|nr:response regulator [Planctomycetota bacterium]
MKLTDFVILLVEDDADQVALLRRAMARAHLVNPLKVVGDGEEAIRYLSGREEYADRRRHPLPSLVLLDLRLPRKSGLDVLEWMRQRPEVRHVPVIVLTSSPLSEDRERALALGAHSYLEKPVDLNGLFEIVRSLGVYWMILHPGAATSGAGARRCEAPAVPVR